MSRRTIQYRHPADANRRRLSQALTVAMYGCLLLVAAGCEQAITPLAGFDWYPVRIWAAPVDRPGLGNLHRVSDELYRGKQPSDQGFEQLKDLGVKTVVELRSDHSDQAEARKTGLEYVHFSMLPFLTPKDEDVVKFLRVATDPERTPVFVHCQYGADRTGTIFAAYRIVVEGWNKQEAINEMKNGGFGWHGFAVLEQYIQNLDVAGIQLRMGIAATQPERVSSRLQTITLP